MAMKQAVKTVADHASRFHQLLAVCDQSTQLTHMLWWNPYLRNNPCNEQANESLHILPVRLHSGLCDLPHCSQAESTPAPAPQPTGLVRERKPLAIYFRRKDRVLLSFPHKSAVAFAHAL